MMQRLREQRHVDRRILERQLLHVAALPGDVLHAAPLGECLRALQHVGRAIDADDPLRPLRRLDRQVSFPTGDIGDIYRRQQQAQRRATTPPSFCPARTARGRSRGLRSFPSEAESLPAAGPRHHESPASAPRRRIGPAASARGRRIRRRAGRERGDRRRNRPRVLRQRRPASFKRRKCRETPDCAMPSTDVSSVTFSRPCLPASTRSRRRRTSSPRSRYSSPACFISMNIHMCMLNDKQSCTACESADASERGELVS